MAQSNYFRAEKVLHNWQSPEEDLGSNPVTIFFIKHLFTLNCTEKNDNKDRRPFVASYKKKVCLLLCLKIVN